MSVALKDSTILTARCALAEAVRRSAERLSDIAKSISDSKRLSDLTQLNNELSELRIMVVGARMATDVAIKEMKGDLPAN